MLVKFSYYEWCVLIWRDNPEWRNENYQSWKSDNTFFFFTKDTKNAVPGSTREFTIAAIAVKKRDSAVIYSYFSAYDQNLESKMSLYERKVHLNENLTISADWDKLSAKYIVDNVSASQYEFVGEGGIFLIWKPTDFFVAGEARKHCAFTNVNEKCLFWGRLYSQKKGGY